MGDPLDTVRTLARRPAVRVGAALLLAGGAASGSLPLLEAPGYELGEATALLAALLAPFVGIAAARAELRRPSPSPLAAFTGAALVLGALIGAAALGAILRAAAGPCAAFGAATWFVPLLAAPSVLLGAALAVAVAFVTRGRRALSGALYAAAALASLAVSLRAAYRGPAAFVFDPLLGGWPGPIYDEALVPDLRVVLFRVAAVAEAVAVAAAAEAFVRAGRAGLRAAIGPAAATLVAAGIAAGCGAGLEAQGLSGSRAAIARALGARREGPRCTMVIPSEKPAAAADALLAECEFQVADLARALALPPPPRVVAYVYRSAEEKRRLVGAAATEYAKPWLAEIHLVDALPPHPLLRHELVHVLGASIAGGAFGVPARYGVIVSAGLVEGLAAALETPRGRWTVDEWARAAKELGMLPDVAAIVGPAGFWGQPPARAYTAAGSFLSFLLERYGAVKVGAAYRTGDVAGAVGVPLHVLVDEWKRSLDAVAPAPGLLDAARPRLGRGSIFSRRCAREVATLEVRAASAAAAGRTAEACALYASARARSGDPRTLLAEADARARAGDLDGRGRGVPGGGAAGRRDRSRPLGRDRVGAGRRRLAPGRARLGHRVLVGGARHAPGAGGDPAPRGEDRRIRRPRPRRRRAPLPPRRGRSRRRPRPRRRGPPAARRLPRRAGARDPGRGGRRDPGPRAGDARDAPAGAHPRGGAPPRGRPLRDGDAGGGRAGAARSSRRPRRDGGGPRPGG